MESERLICGSTDITYNKGYVALWCKNYDLPDTFEIDGEILMKKDHFHVSLLCVKKILETNPDIEDEVLKHFCDFIKDNEIEFEGFTKEFRLAENDERKSIVALCKVSNLHKFAEYLTEKIGVNIAPQPAHVTIYTLQPNAGIGLNSPEEMGEKSHKINVPQNIQEALT